MKNNWQGASPAVTTQLTPDGSPDLPGTTRHEERERVPAVIHEGIEKRPAAPRRTVR